MEAKGLVFVFVGDGEPPPLSADVPPGFLDDDMAIDGKLRFVNSNWRLGVENGFDAEPHLHPQEIEAGARQRHRAAARLRADRSGRATHAPKSSSTAGRTACTTCSANSSIPVFEGTIEGEPAIEGTSARRSVADNISIWMPGVLKVDPWPQEGMIQFEWYVPVRRHAPHLPADARPAREQRTPKSEATFARRCATSGSTSRSTASTTTTCGRARPTEDFYRDDRGWVEERLFETDLAIVEWRQFASQHNRGLQKLEHL